MRISSGNEKAAAEMVGTLILVAIFTAAVALVAVTFFSQPPPQEVPALNAIISNQSQVVYITHNGGDSVPNGSYKILVDGTDVTSAISKTGSPSQWEIGDVITYTKPGTVPPTRVDVVYAGNVASGYVLETALLGSITVTPTAITISPSPTSTIPPAPPITSFIANTTSGVVPLTVMFNDTSTGAPTSWSWQFGDGGTSTAQNVTHQYILAGNYTVNLTATNAGGSNTTSKSNYITVLPLPPVASFTANPLTGVLPLNITFNDTSTGLPTSWFWQFGTGGTSTVQNVTYQYQNYGNYTVNLTATNAGGSNTTSKSNYIAVCWGDNFNGNSLGSAWTTYNGVWSVSGGTLSQTSTANADPKKAIVSNSGQTFGTNMLITAEVRINTWTENADMSRGGVSLFTGTSNGQGYNLAFHNNHNTVAFLDDQVTWGPSYTYTWTTGTWYWFRFEMLNGTMYGKVWQAGTSEPSSWPYTWAYNTGRTGYPALNGGSANSAGSATVSFDNVTVCPVS
jgi:PKD repeat protein